MNWTLVQLKCKTQVQKPSAKTKTQGTQTRQNPTSSLQVRLPSGTSNQSLGRPINLSANQSLGQSISRPINLSANQSLGQSIPSGRRDLPRQLFQERPKTRIIIVLRGRLFFFAQINFDWVDLAGGTWRVVTKIDFGYEADCCRLS